MTGYFVTATGTDIGKTLVTCALVHQLRQQGRAVTALKSVQSGFDASEPETSDAGQILEASGLSTTPENLDRVAPFRFMPPLSPDMAAAREGRSLRLDDVVAHARSFSGLVLVEGVGGVMVPLDGRHTVLDWMEALAWPVILVTGSYLGTLSHTLTAHSTLTSRRLELAGIVISESVESPVPLEETMASLRPHLGASLPILTVPRVDRKPSWLDRPDLTSLVT